MIDWNNVDASLQKQIEHWVKEYAKQMEKPMMNVDGMVLGFSKGFCEAHNISLQHLGIKTTAFDSKNGEKIMVCVEGVIGVTEYGKEFFACLEVKA